jgi:predicted HicB family RNase H-like nuclease
MTEISLRGALDIGPYKGYHGHADYDPEHHRFHGRVVGTRDVISFVGENPAELTASFKDSIEDYLEFCESEKREPNKPYSGNFLVRTTPQLHRALSIAADFDGKSLNQFVVDAAERAAVRSTAKSVFTSPNQMLTEESGALWYTGNPLSLDPAVDLIPAFATGLVQGFESPAFGGRLASMPMRIAVQSTWKAEA